MKLDTGIALVSIAFACMALMLMICPSLGVEVFLCSSLDNVVLENKTGELVLSCSTDQECEELNPHILETGNWFEKWEKEESGKAETLESRACAGGDDVESAQLAPFLDCE